MEAALPCYLGTSPTPCADGTKMAAWQIRLIIDEARSTTRAAGRCQVCPSVIFLTPLLLWKRRWGHAAARQKFLTLSSQRLKGTGPASANGQTDRCPRSWSDEPTAVVADETLISGAYVTESRRPFKSQKDTIWYSLVVCLVGIVQGNSYAVCLHTVYDINYMN